jgi:hypothetical protein
MGKRYTRESGYELTLNADIDIDFADRTLALTTVKHIPASIFRDGALHKHASGVYVTEMPVEPTSGLSAIDYKQAESRGYIKLDFLNVSVYQQVKSEEHLIELMNKVPDWNKLLDKEFFDKVIHINGHFHEMKRMPEPINSVERLMMFIALIRPGKKHLIGKTWKEVAVTIWDKTDDGYSFKMSHACAYSHLCIVHMNLLLEQS